MKNYKLITTEKIPNEKVIIKNNEIIVTDENKVAFKLTVGKFPVYKNGKRIG